MINRIIISPPFGHYLSFKWATSVDGTYTLYRRPGLITQCIKTIRPVDGGWVNRIGFRNKGIKNVTTFNPNKIYSISGMDNTSDWHEILDYIPSNISVELNVGCPNVKQSCINTFIIERYREKFPFVSIKIPPTDKAESYIRMAHLMDLDAVHLCNTLPTDRGGESGKKLKEQSIKWISYTKWACPGLPIIGGGGIYTTQDVLDYYNAGVTYFSLGTIWFTPWRVKKVVEKINFLINKS
jgi:dihydroorotate dehydrogenase